ncbi:methyltransferase [Candidatus Woesearchaeota archaeon]|nr:methyltransferase [Candidatus Woesearchaeota archaeon]
MPKLLIFLGKKIEGRILHKPHTYYITETTKDFTTQHGTIKKADLNKKDGAIIKSSTGTEFTLISAGFHDIHSRIKKLPQTIPHKDIARIIIQTGLNKNSTVLDAGLGSGALAIYLAGICKKVISYEIDEQTIELAKMNMKSCGVTTEIKNKDVYQAIDETKLDAIILDLPEPWKVVKHAKKALAVGGWLVAYNPTINQIAKFNDELSNNKEMMHVKNIEIIERQWDAKEQIIRPVKTPIGHSGFLSFARRIH